MNIMERILIFCAISIALCNFIKIEAKEGEEKPLGRSIMSTSYNSLSPFYRNEKQIVSQIEQLVHLNREQDALALMRQVIATEKRWRHRLCIQLFGESSCNNNGNSAEPFFMWKRKLIHDLEVDPTQEIINQISKHIEF